MDQLGSGEIPDFPSDWFDSPVSEGWMRVHKESLGPPKEGASYPGRKDEMV